MADSRPCNGPRNSTPEAGMLPLLSKGLRHGGFPVYSPSPGLPAAVSSRGAGLGSSRHARKIYLRADSDRITRIYGIEIKAEDKKEERSRREMVRSSRFREQPTRLQSSG